MANVDPIKALELASTDPEAFAKLSPAEQVAAARLQKQQVSVAPVVMARQAMATPSPTPRQGLESAFALKVRMAAKLAELQAQKAKAEGTPVAPEQQPVKFLEELKKQVNPQGAGGPAPVEPTTEFAKKVQEATRAAKPKPVDAPPQPETDQTGQNPVSKLQTLLSKYSIQVGSNEFAQPGKGVVAQTEFGVKDPEGVKSYVDVGRMSPEDRQFVLGQLPLEIQERLAFMWER